MKGLIIKPYWGNKILSGEKTWEIRGSNTLHRGHTEIIFSRTQCRWGHANLVDSFEIDKDIFDLNYENHRIHLMQFDPTRYKKFYAWEFENPVMYDQGIPYKHPQGAVIWVNLGANHEE